MLVDSFVLRILPERKARNRYGQLMTTNQIKYGLLKSDLFLVCLFTLVINDFILKFNFPGVVTGKLSDFSGLFVFPFFFSVLLPNWRKTIYLLSGFLFILWKMPISDSLINVFNTLDIFFIKRVADVTDLISLVILPISLAYFNREYLKPKRISKLQVYFFSTFSLFAFTATTIGQKEFKKELEINKTYNLPLNKETFLKDYTSQSRGFKLQESDTSLYLYCEAVDNRRIRLTFEASLFKLNNTTTRLNIYKLTHYEIENKGLFSGPDEEEEEYYKSLPAWGFIKILNENLLRTIESKELGHNERIWYDIKPKLDSMNASWKNQGKN